jgi:hypothetical protein
VTASPQDAPLSTEERELAARTDVYAVWYEDRFGWGADRDPAFVIAIFLTRAEAEADAKARGGRKEAGFDGYDADERPAKLLWFLERGEVSPEQARRVLRGGGS